MQLFRWSRAQVSERQTSVAAQGGVRLASSPVFFVNCLTHTQRRHKPALLPYMLLQTQLSSLDPFLSSWNPLVLTLQLLFADSLLAGLLVVLTRSGLITKQSWMREL